SYRAREPNENEAGMKKPAARFFLLVGRGCGTFVGQARRCAVCFAADEASPRYAGSAESGLQLGSRVAAQMIRRTIRPKRLRNASGFAWSTGTSSAIVVWIGEARSPWNECCMLTVQSLIRIKTSIENAFQPLCCRAQVYDQGQKFRFKVGF